MTKLFTFFGLFSFILLLASCSSPEDIIEPTHFTRVPVPVNLSAVADTTVTGKVRVTLTWSTASINNLKSYEVYRASLTKTSRYFPLVPIVTTTTFVDSFAVTFTDTFKVFYYITPTGEDRFVGKNSDTLYVPITK